MKRAVLYIRVSTDEQAERGSSLQHQEDRLRQYCEINDIVVDKLYQEDYSAKTFDRPVFNELLQYCKKCKKDIDQLIILKWDRFSRNISESYTMLRIFEKLGISVTAAEQPLDLSIPENKIMLSFYLVAPEVENDRRSMNTVAGMKQRLLRGKWCAGSPPLGYTINKNEDRLEINEKGEFISEAFKMILEGEKITKISEHFKLRGFDRSSKHWGRILRNEIYTGMMVNALLDEPVPGQHEALVTKQDFYKVQNILEGRNHKAVRSSNIDEDVPLKGIVSCECGNQLSGYVVRKKQRKSGTYKERKKAIPYYICNNNSCRQNVSGKTMHQALLDLLSEFTISPKLIPVIRKLAVNKFKVLLQVNGHDQSLLKKELTRTENRLKNLEIKHLDGDYDTLEYKDLKRVLTKRKIELSAKISDGVGTLSNPPKLVDKVVAFLTKMPEIWLKSGILDKRRLIERVFPDGISYSKGEGAYRTPRINGIITLITSISITYKQKSQQNAGLVSLGSPSVPLIEPPPEVFIEDLNGLQEYLTKELLEL